MDFQKSMGTLYLYFQQSGEEGEDGMRDGEPNQFDNLCQGGSTPLT